MSTPAVLVFDDGAPTTIGGLTLTERAVLMARDAGLDRIYVWGPRALDRGSIGRLHERGARPAQPPAGPPPLRAIPDDSAVLAIGPSVLFGPRLLATLARGSERVGEPLVVAEAGAPLLIHVPAALRHDVAAASSLEEIADALAARAVLRHVPAGEGFARRVPARDAASIERDYIRLLTGKGESYFTKKIRRFSVPLTARLVRAGATPTQVTLGGLLLAIASAWCIAQGSYAAGVLGGVLYYVSMIFDCSDGEVARVTLREGPFGAWLETVVDYVTYFLLLAAVTAASASRLHAAAYLTAAQIALVGTVVIILVAGYLRHRVAAADPGQFDDASAKALASSSRFHRFARWGRQWIKRSTMAHLVLFLGLANALPVLLYLWAFGAVVGAIVILLVEPFVVRRVAVPAREHVHG